MENFELKELDIKEMQETSGGILPLFGAVLLGFAFGAIFGGLLVGENVFD